jgi:hypothetical protein
MADAAERIAQPRQKREDDQTAAVAWLKAKRDEMGFTALRKMLRVEAANWEKVIDRKQNRRRFY